MAYWLLNSAVVTAPGTYAYRLLTEREAADWLHAHPDAVSRVGYPATAERIAALCGWRPALSRETSVLAPGDEALVVRLPYRVQDPGTKATHEPQAWEYGLLRRER